MFHRLNEENVDTVAALFSLLKDYAHFHPHAFTRDVAEQICKHRGLDGFYGGFRATVMLAYGLLRGWDAGFEDPSLGIVIHPEFRGHGLGKRMMVFLHEEAARLGARRIRLRVHPDNHAAIGMYERIGYVFDRTMDRGQRVGWYYIPQAPR